MLHSSTRQQVRQHVTDDSVHCVIVGCRLKQQHALNTANIHQSECMRVLVLILSSRGWASVGTGWCDGGTLVADGQNSLNHVFTVPSVACSESWRPAEQG